MTLTDPLLHCLHHMHEKENETKFYYTQNSSYMATIVYDTYDWPICNSRTVLCNGDIYGYDTCYEVSAIVNM